MLKAIITAATILTLSTGADARIKRSHKAVSAFKRENPCPSTGTWRGACKGWIVDHIIPLVCGGSDTPGNMQWQTTTDAKSKDKWERKGCRHKKN